MKKLLRSRRAAATIAICGAGLLAAPAVAADFDNDWAPYSSNFTIPAGAAKHSNDPWWLKGVYCNVKDANRNIEIAAVYPSNGTWYQYGTFVSYGSGGWRTYSGSTYLAGACKNPHSVPIGYFAKDRFQQTSTG